MEQKNKSLKMFLIVLFLVAAHMSHFGMKVIYFNRSRLTPDSEFTLLSVSLLESALLSVHPLKSSIVLLAPNRGKALRTCHQGRTLRSIGCHLAQLSADERDHQPDFRER